MEAPRSFPKLPQLSSIPNNPWNTRSGVPDWFSPNIFEFKISIFLSNRFKISNSV